MLFNSAEFLVFLAAVLAVDLCLRHRGPMRKPFLLAASYVFYAGWDWRFLGLILLSTAVDFFVGRRLAHTEAPRSRRLLLLVSLAVNLGVLGAYKYLDFFIESFNRMLGTEIGLARLLLPIGISFYTFQTLSYTIDVYRRKLEPTRSFLDFALFVAFFPQLVAGPIVRARNFLPQLEQQARPTRVSLAWGTADILAGLFKKVVVADTLGMHVVDPFYADPASYSWDGALIALYAFALQVYGDFAGYSQIAIGCARLLGFRLPVNFRAPYVSRSFTEFWRRWHISLSTWLRDYLYIPLGGSRGGMPKTYRNVFLTLLISGLWHGAAWNFVLFGAIHGLLLVASHYRSERRRRRGREPDQAFLPRMADILIVFHVWVLTLITFRGHSLEQIGQVLQALFRPGSSLDPALAPFLYLMACAWIWHQMSPRYGPRVERAFLRSPPELRAAVVVLFFGLLAALKVPENPFIYFQF